MDRLASDAFYALVTAVLFTLAFIAYCVVILPCAAVLKIKQELLP